VVLTAIGALLLIAYSQRNNVPAPENDQAEPNQSTALKADNPAMVHVCVFTTPDGIDWKIAATSHTSYPGMDQGCTDFTREQYSAFRTDNFLAGQGRGPDPDHITLP